MDILRETQVVHKTLFKLERVRFLVKRNRTRSVNPYYRSFLYVCNKIVLLVKSLPTRLVKKECGIKMYGW